jgi:peptide/nickel transport system ATP-binding protein
VLEGDVADPSNLPTGCHFHPRCRYAIDACKTGTPPLIEVAPDHAVRCVRAKDLTLAGVAAA